MPVHTRQVPGELGDDLRGEWLPRWSQRSRQPSASLNTDTVSGNGGARQGTYRPPHRKGRTVKPSKSAGRVVEEQPRERGARRGGGLQLAERGAGPDGEGAVVGADERRGSRGRSGAG